MTITLQRLFETNDGTYGRLKIDQDHAWFVVERPKTGDHARIPAGSYPMKLGMFYGGDGVGGKPDYPAYEISVPGRSEIKIHIANLPEQLLGCIAPGKQIACLAGTGLGVLHSTQAFGEFMSAMGGKQDDWIVVYDPAQ